MGSEMCIRDSYEVDTAILNGDEDRRPTAVMLRSRLWQTGREVGVAFRAAFAVLEYVVERGEELEPPLDLCITVPHFAYAFQCLVVGEYSECGSPKLTSEAFESPNDACRPRNQEESNTSPSLA